MEHYTTIEQSKHLLDLGLNPKSADMWWLYVTAQGKHIAMMYEEPDPHYLARMKSYGIKNAAIPCWSLGALIELMPKVISVPVDERSAYFYSLEWQFANDNSLRYIATNRGKCLIDIYSDHDTRNKSLIETAFEMVCWLLKNGYIKKGE